MHSARHVWVLLWNVSTLSGCVSCLDCMAGLEVVAVWIEVSSFHTPPASYHASLTRLGILIPELRGAES